MGRIVVTNSVSLDGVMQAPGRPDEDSRGGFPYGGWGLRYADAVQGAEMGKAMLRPGALLFGRRTYQSLYEYWPQRNDGNPYTEVLDRTGKYVVSRTLREPLPWQNSTRLPGVSAVAELKRELDGTLAVLGSGQLVRTLQQHGLIDEFVLLVHPLVLGTGRRLFDGIDHARFRLVDSVPTSTGVIIATYAKES